MASRLVLATVVATTLTFGSPAAAFTVESAFSDGCHEQITEAALRNVRATLATAPPIPPTPDEQALIADLPFTVPADMQDLASASLLVGVRDNDLKGHAPTEAAQMAIIQGDPSLQQEHCLRNLTDLEPTGSTTALARCSAFILERAMQAVAALDATGEPDPSQRILLPVNLAVRGDTAANLPVFWVRIGQAMHALEDAFAHTYRTTDGTKVTVVLNWVDLVDKQLDAAVNGPPHKIDLDHCNAGDEIRNRNTAQAIEASTALLRAVLDPSLTPAEKSTEVQAVVAQYLAYSPGCTDANAWCNAPENAYTQLNACGCDVVGSQGGSMAALSLVGLALLALRRRRRLAAALVVPAALLVPTAARAEDQPHFAVAANVAGSFIDPAVAGSLGVRFAFGQHFLLGVDGELNGWYGVNGSRLDLGSANVYASAIVRYPIVDRFALRTTFNLGVAIETVALYGVPSGSVGFFAGISPLGIEWEAAKHVYLVFNPLGYAIPVTHLTGSPFGYSQFRTQLGVELAF